VYSNQTIARSIFTAVLAATSLALTGCGKVIEPMPAPAAAQFSNYELTSGINSSDIFIHLLQMDLSTKNKADPPPGIQLTVEIDALPDGTLGRCTPSEEAVYTTVLTETRPTRDAANIGKVRFELLHQERGQIGKYAMCYAVHTKGGGWRWNFEKRYLVIDTQPSGGLDPIGNGHIEFQINANNIDLIAFLPAQGSANIAKVNYTAAPATP
jgi:hypothetical protein